MMYTFYLFPLCFNYKSNHLTACQFLSLSNYVSRRGSIGKGYPQVINLLVRKGISEGNYFTRFSLIRFSLTIGKLLHKYLNYIHTIPITFYLLL
jgi:hypothetical protein